MLRGVRPAAVVMYEAGNTFLLRRDFVDANTKLVSDSFCNAEWVICEFDREEFEYMFANLIRVGSSMPNLNWPMSTFVQGKLMDYISARRGVKSDRIVFTSENEFSFVDPKDRSSRSVASPRDFYFPKSLVLSDNKLPEIFKLGPNLTLFSNAVREVISSYDKSGLRFLVHQVTVNTAL